VLVNWVNPDHQRFNTLNKQFDGRLVLYEMAPKEWKNQRMYRKIRQLLEMPFQTNDRVFVLDTDLLIQDEIFNALSEGDVYVTSRHYNYWYAVNGGV